METTNERVRVEEKLCESEERLSVCIAQIEQKDKKVFNTLTSATTTSKQQQPVARRDRSPIV